MRRSRRVHALVVVLILGGLIRTDNAEATFTFSAVVTPSAGGHADEGAALQSSAKPEQQGAQTPPRKFVAPIRGVAEIGYLKPVTKVVGNEVVTTIRIKNLSNAPIAGLRVDEYWFDAQGNPLPSDYELLKKPLMPGEIVEIELRVPRNPKMHRNQYQFRHANGQIKPRLMNKF